MSTKNKKNRDLLNELINKLRSWQLLFQFADWLHTLFIPANDFSPEFKNLFFRKEIGELYGDRNNNFGKIVLLYITLFISVGFGIQSKKYFNKQLDNPFVRYIPISIDGDARLYTDAIIDSLSTEFMQENKRRSVNLDTIQTYSAGNSRRFSSEYIENEFIGMGINYNSDLLNEAVFNKDNNYFGEPYSSVEDRSIVVTLDLLKDLYLVDSKKSFEEIELDELPAYIMFQPDGFGEGAPLLIQAVAEQLPWGNDFILPSKFDDHLNCSTSKVYFDEMDDQTSFYIHSDLDLKKLEKLSVDLAEQYGVQTDSSNFVLEKTKSIHKTILISFQKVDESNSFTTELKNKIANTFGIKESLIVDACYKLYGQPGAIYSVVSDKSGVFVVFDNLRKVKDFNEELKEYSSSVITNLMANGSSRKLKGLELEMSSINLRIILNIIEIIVLAFLFIIGILSITSVVSFVRVLFEKYFQKIEKNIGTFMAFGINIQVVYVIMLIVFIVTSLMLSFVAAFIIGEILEYFILLFLGSSVGEDVKLFSILNIYIVVAFVLIGAANWLAFKKASKIFSRWPGDIINDR